MLLPLQFNTVEETKAFYAGFRDELEKDAVSPDAAKNLALLATGAGGALLLRRANEDRKIGKQIRQMQNQQGA